MDVDVSSHGIDRAQLIHPRFTTGKPQDTAQDPIPLWLFLPQVFRVKLSCRATPYKYTVLWQTCANLGTNGVVTAGGLFTAKQLTSTIGSGRDGIAIQAPSLLPHLKGLPMDENSDLHSNCG